MNLSQETIERIAEAVCRRLERKQAAREDARYLASMDLADLIAHQRAELRRTKRESVMEAKTETLGHARRG